MSEATTCLVFIQRLLKLLLFYSQSTAAKYLILFYHISMIYTVFSATFFILKSVRDIATLVEALMPTIVFLLSTVKLLNLRTFRFDLGRIYRIVCTDLYERCNDYYQKGQIHKANYISYLLVRTLLVGIIFFELAYMLPNIFFKEGGLGMPIAHFKELVPGNGLAFYMINVLFQIFLGYLAMLATVTADGILLWSLLHLNAYLDVFKDKVVNFDATDVINELRRLWRYQVLLFRLRRSIERVFLIQISVQFLTSMGILCVSLYGMKGDTLAVMGAMVVLAVSEIFCICFMGQLIENKGNRILNQLYFLPWVEMSNPDCKRLLFMMTASRTGMTITTPLGSLNLQSFSQVLKTTYSLYTLLHNAA